MALSNTEYWDTGKVWDRATSPPSLAVTTDTTNARWWTGFLRDPDGRLVIKYV